MYNNLVALFLLVGCGLVACTPQDEVHALVRQTRQVLPVGVYPTPGYNLPGVVGGSVRPLINRPTGPGPIAPGHEAHAAIVGQVHEGPDYDGNFNYGFETENGISTQVSGSLINGGTPVEGQAMRGSYSYTSPEGVPITVNWYADDTGFHAEGAHLPRQPVVPTGPEVPYPYPGAIRPVSLGGPVVGPTSLPLVTPVSNLVS